MTQTSEAAFETVSETRLLANGYVAAATARGIALLKERCAALIAAAVTGKIELPRSADSLRVKKDIEGPPQTILDR